MADPGSEAYRCPTCGYLIPAAQYESAEFDIAHMPCPQCGATTWDGFEPVRLQKWFLDPLLELMGRQARGEQGPIDIVVDGVRTQGGIITSVEPPFFRFSTMPDASSRLLIEWIHRITDTEIICETH